MFNNMAGQLVVCDLDRKNKIQKEDIHQAQTLKFDDFSGSHIDNLALGEHGRISI